jgi:hypothetical protein
MSTKQTRELDPFQTALLTQLRDVVTERAAAGVPTREVPGAGAPRPKPVGRARRSRTVRWVAASVACLAAAGVGVATLGAPAAYAISEDGAGDVTVTINRLEGADALERDLAAYGVAADVTYTPPGKTCAEGRYTDVGGPGFRMSGQSTIGGASSITIPKDAIKPGQTLVLESMWPDANSWAMRTGVAQGPVGECRLMDFVVPQGAVTERVDVPGSGDAPERGVVTHTN